jgi:hypothetical protein
MNEITETRVEISPRKVRIVGDTFKNIYTVVAEITRTQRDGNRLYGGDVRYVIRTWAGRERFASTIVDADTPWNETDAQFASIRVRNRNAIARRREARRVAAIEYGAKLTDRLAADVRMIRSFDTHKQDIRITAVARNHSLDRRIVAALVEAN